jgi:hypothetical protein
MAIVTPADGPSAVRLGEVYVGEVVLGYVYAVFLEDYAADFGYAIGYEALPFCHTGHLAVAFYRVVSWEVAALNHGGFHTEDTAGNFAAVWISDSRQTIYLPKLDAFRLYFKQFTQLFQFMLQYLFLDRPAVLFCGFADVASLNNPAAFVHG